MTTGLNPEKSLILQTECPACHVSWTIIKEMLYDGPGTDNYNTAVTDINNCRVCHLRFEAWL